MSSVVQILIPEKLIKPIAINAVTIKVIPSPFSGPGTWEYYSFSLMAARPTIASSHPIPDPKPYAVAMPTLAKSRCCMKSDPPRMAQFTAISGRKIPREA